MVNIYQSHGFYGIVTYQKSTLKKSTTSQLPKIHTSRFQDGELLNLGERWKTSGGSGG